MTILISSVNIALGYDETFEEFVFKMCNFLVNVHISKSKDYLDRFMTDNFSIQN